jgi:ubiquinone/menaquinone biosynthesis C-methylase UbiE
MNGEKMSFADNTFDLAFAHGVLAYTNNAEKMILEIHRVLKPGAKAILMMYNKNSWLYYFSKIMNFKLGREDAPVFKTYSANEFMQMLTMFSQTTMQYERFPLETRIHKGVFAFFYNRVVVPAFNLIPREIIRSLGAHLIVISVK